MSKTNRTISRGLPPVNAPCVPIPPRQKLPPMDKLHRLHYTTGQWICWRKDAIDESQSVDPHEQ